MARMIDGNWLYKKVVARYRISTGIEHRCERDFLDLICNAPTLTTPNEPLTLEQLRKGESVVPEMDKKKLEIAFNLVVKYGFCGNCRSMFEGKHCMECNCYQNGVKIIKEALFGTQAALRREQDG